MGNNVVNAKRMFKHACAFSGCAKFCAHEPWNIERRLPDYSIAGIVNSAFACEVFIKSLLVFNGIPVEQIVDTRNRGMHKLSDLWQKLENINLTTTDLARKRVLREFNSTDDSAFYTMLDNVSDAFVFWRYIYEKSSGKIHVKFLTLFREVLQEICCETFYGMSWNDYTKGNEV